MNHPIALSERCDENKLLAAVVGLVARLIMKSASI
jgi:hypothetical protein